MNFFYTTCVGCASCQWCSDVAAIPVECRKPVHLQVSIRGAQDTFVSRAPHPCSRRDGNG